MNNRFRIPAALMVTGMLITLVACTPKDEPTVRESSDQDPTTFGISETADRVIVTGTLMHIDDGDGLFWAIADEQEPTSSRIPPVIAELSNPEDVDAESVIGDPVRVEGVWEMSGDGGHGARAIHADSIEVLHTVVSRIADPEAGIFPAPE